MRQGVGDTTAGAQVLSESAESARSFASVASNDVAINQRADALALHLPIVRHVDQSFAAPILKDNHVA
jgi:hypothetical protein